MNPRVLALLLRPGKGQTAVLVLPVVAFAIVTTLVLSVIGGAQSFWEWTDDYAPLYQALAAVALILLVVPLLSLGGAAARLSARRRDERLSTLRLLGVTPAGVTIATVIESTLVAGAGALAGVIGHVALSPLIGLIHFRGEALGFDAVLLPTWQIVIVVAGVLLLASASAAIALRRVVISPLGVRMRTTGTSVRGIRAVIAVLVVVCGFAAVKIVPSIAGFLVTIVLLSAVFAATLAVLNLLGPWVLKISAAWQLKRGEEPVRLLSARFVLDDPKSAWRQVGGIAMASFMAVFAGTGASLMDAMSAPGASPADVALSGDIRTGLFITLIGSFLMVAVSVGVNQASDVLDQRELHRSLHHLGVPVSTVDRARRRAIMSPLLVTAISAALSAVILVFPLMGIAMLTTPVSVLTIAAVLAVGIGIVWVGTLATRPMLARSFSS